MHTALRLAWVLCAFAIAALAADIGFDFDGAIEGASATDTSYNTGGTISVNGYTVKIPKNLQVNFPAAFVPWKDFVAAYKSGSFSGYEVSVVGNFVGTDGPIAASVGIAQFSTQGSVGFISAVNNDGTINIKDGPTIRINDPNGVYSVGYTGAPFLTADDESPSISSFSGFPMCVPRKADDPLCPASNRPDIGGSKQGSINAPNPLAMAPFMPGDFLEYSGFKNSAGEIVCYSIVATNIQIAAGTGNPSFIRVEDVNIGVYSADPNAEVAETRFIGYVSDIAGSPLTIWAVDIDPCTGKETPRKITTVDVQTGAARNKFVSRFKWQATDKYTREYRLTVTGTPKTTSNNITAGVYISPPTEVIQPELSVPGIPPINNDFSAFTHLTQGIGPDEAGNMWGPLSPFPQSGVKTFDVSTCPPPGTGTGGGTTPSPPPVPVDTVKVTSATLTQTGGGTLSVTCTSTNKDNTAVGMTVDYRVGTVDRTNVGMTPSTTTPGTWTFTGTKLKGASSVICKSKLGGSATLTVTARRKKRSAKLDERKDGDDDLCKED
ncbi:hypothetical protein F5X68DRAFT_274043 [Plectosphaerella plurivora]|uniref:Ig-like domain-containing protein n=1 Tax=Plectosphaerella plurivora TaxID=936078 RepID=A0A9P8VGR3_9PEZI|nr:hypothetical protein F5X68DRAFT_274043 [Plectosphaerella plurivora]